MKAIEIKENEFEKIIKEQKKVLIDCYAPWCGPCRLLSPVIEEIANETEECAFYKINVDNAEEISKKYGIMSIPTLLLFENGELKQKSIGFKNKEEIKKIIK